MEQIYYYLNRRVPAQRKSMSSWASQSLGLLTIPFIVNKSSGHCCSHTIRLEFPPLRGFMTFSWMKEIICRNSKVYRYYINWTIMRERYESFLVQITTLTMVFPYSICGIKCHDTPYYPTLKPQWRNKGFYCVALCCIHNVVADINARRWWGIKLIN